MAVEPWGNGVHLCGFRGARLGPYLAPLSDRILLECVSHLDEKGLCVLCKTSLGLHAFGSYEEFWKGVGLRWLESGRPLKWRGSSWKTSLLRVSDEKKTKLSKTLLYSDLLYQPRRLVNELAPATFVRDLTENARRCSPESFREGSSPAVVEDQRFRDMVRLSVWDEMRGAAHAGGIDWNFADFLEYATNNSDEDPLYVFDKKGGGPNVLKMLEPPPIVDDLFELCGDFRPDFAWLLAGGPRSGSSWHVDPNGTSAWNVPMRGSKLWLLLPPGNPPPGVHPSKDGLDLVAPRSSAEWLAQFLQPTLKLPQLKIARAHPGDLVFVPQNWWHMVVNLDDYNVALTRNFCSPVGLRQTLRLLRTKPYLISGLSERKQAAPFLKDKAALGKKFHDHFVDQLKKHRPDLLARVEDDLAQPTNLWSKLMLKRPSSSFSTANLDDAILRKNKLPRTNNAQSSPPNLEEEKPATFSFRFDCSS